MRAKSCTVCGARTDGSPRCPNHQLGKGRRSRSCITCGVTSSGDYCPAHDPQAETNRANYRSHYRSRDYQANRRLRFNLARGRCESCHLALEWEGGGWECDHLVPLRQGGTNNISNLRILCIPCHRIKTAEDRRRTRE